MIEVENLSYKIGPKTILDQVGFSARAGKLVAIVGSNGAGKSTLIKLLSGGLKPAAGRAFWNGRNIAHCSEQEMALTRAVLTQNVSMSGDFPVDEVVLMGRYPHFNGNPTKEDWESVKACMRETGVDKMAKRTYFTLSGGEQQRVQIARALAQVHPFSSEKPTFLLLDEPLNNLDIRHQHACLEMCRDYCQKGNMAIMVIHDINLAALYADEILLLNKGKLLAFGPPAEVLTEELLSEAYDFPVRVEGHPYHNCPVVYFGCPARQTAAVKQEFTNTFP